MSQSPYWKPKFYCTAFVLVSATGLRITNLLGPGEWVAVVNIAMATFVAGSVAENKVMKDAPPTT